MRRHALARDAMSKDAAGRRAVGIRVGRNHGPFGEKNLSSRWRSRYLPFVWNSASTTTGPSRPPPGSCGSHTTSTATTGRARARVQRGHAAALRIGGAPARGSRDELLAAGFHRPLPADARRAGVLPDRVRRQRAADRAVRGAGLRGPGGGHAPGRVRRAMPGRDPAHGRTVRGPVAAARAVARLVAALLHHRRPLPADRPDQLHQAVPGGLSAAGPGPDPVVPGGPHLAGPGRRGGPGADQQAAHDQVFRGAADRHHPAGAAAGLRGAVPPSRPMPGTPDWSGRACRCSATRCRCSPTSPWTRSTGPG